MRQAIRSCVTTGVAALAASMIVVTPGAAPAPDIHAVPDVALTAGIDFIGEWVTQIDDAVTNATTSFTGFSDALTALFDAVAAHPTALFTDLPALFDAVTFLGGDQTTFLDPLSKWTLDPAHQLVFSLTTFQGILGPLFHLSASPLTGVLISASDPFIAPGAALVSGIELIFGDLIFLKDPTAALQELVNLPADVVFSPLNGAPLLLLGLASLGFGGLLSPGETVNGVGGSIFDATGVVTLPGNEVGPLGALAGLAQVLAEVISGEVPTAPAGAAVEALGGLPDLDFTDLLNGLF